ncbi:hypothetical protein H5410_007508 [Solanum commersonii]|uniref:Non-specific serine/threonine protein kinase n=1 Tax=Solanum commersonii TaxID=4109 RepID=A0A9J6ADR6_SOLCO|nr:hypothetical protein H5410_007508 [Solanum commersonii]
MVPNLPTNFSQFCSSGCERNLGTNKLNGSLPKSFLNLTSLDELLLYENCFSGDLLPFKMNNLQIL